MKILAAMILAAGLMACSYQTSETYRISETGKKLAIEHAVVTSSREVTVTEDSDISKNWYGPIAGAALAGAAADVGGASDAIVIGAVVVGLGLAYLIEEYADTRKGHEYILRNDETGEEFAVVVSVKDDAQLLPPDTSVRIIGSGPYRRVEQE